MVVGALVLLHLVVIGRKMPLNEGVDVDGVANDVDAAENFRVDIFGILPLEIRSAGALLDELHYVVRVGFEMLER